MNDCIFCKIIKGEIPSQKLWEDENYLAFLTIQPINPGHTLIIPKKHSEYIFDLDDQSLGELLIVSKPIASAIKKSMNPKTGKIGIMVAGLQVHHTHLHLIPMNSEGDLNFSKAKSAAPKELQSTLEKIKAALAS